MKTKIIFILPLFLMASISAYGREFKVLSYNVWGIKLGPFKWTEDLDKRIRLMPDAIQATKSDIVCLQEVWRSKDRKFLERELEKRGYHHFVYRKRGMIRRGIRGFMGNGILIASKWPFTYRSKDLVFKRFTHSFEFFADKGATHVVADVPKKGELDFYCTHLGSVGYDGKNGDYPLRLRQKRFEQIEELGDFIEESKKTSIQILAGDFNFHEKKWNPDANDFFEDIFEPDYEELTVRFGLEDSYRKANPLDKGITSDKNNLYRQNLPGPSSRLDYVFYRHLSEEFKVKRSIVVFNGILNDGSDLFQLSDHYGVMTDFEWK